MATIKKAQFGGPIKKAERQYKKAVKQVVREAHKDLPKKKEGGKVKKAQKGCAIARQTAKEDKKAIREWGKMSKMSDKQIDRQNRRDERASRREEARESRPSGSKLRGNFMFKAGGKLKKKTAKKK